jgi:Ca-activated chloride channel family protein
VSDVYPRRVPDLFAGKPLLVHGRFARGGTARVKVRGTVNGRRFERVIGVTLPDASTDDTHAAHATLWARAAVHDRMNRIFLRDDPELIEEVTELGLRYRMVTQYTSFVAVEERRAPP